MMKLSGWKRQTGALAVMPLVVSQLGAQFLGWDTQDADKWLMLLSVVGLPLWGVGWIDKVLPFTTKIEKILIMFNVWAAKQRKNQSGETTVGTIGKVVGIAGIVTAALVGNNIQDKALEEKVTADIQASIDSVDTYNKSVDSVAYCKADSINRENVKPAEYAAVRPEQSGNQKTDKFNPLYYHESDEFVIVKTYRGRQGSKDTTLISEQFIEADKRWLLAVKAAAVMENPTIDVSAGTVVDPIEEIPSGTK